MPSYPVPPQNLSGLRSTMTGLSGRRHVHYWNFTGLSGVARTSLVVLGVMALGSSGCLITDKAEFSPPTPTPPFVLNLDPPASEILNIPRKPGAGMANVYVETTNVAFEVRSDDKRFLWSTVFVDYPSSDPLRPASVACTTAGGPDIGTLDTPRIWGCNLLIPPNVSEGCHSITALVTHDKVINEPRPPPPPESLSDLGMGTWWAQIGADSTYFPCEPHPTRSPDAGADARVDGVGP